MVRQAHLVLLGGVLVSCASGGDRGRSSHDRCFSGDCAVKQRSLPAVRGKIVDRSGVVLAVDGSSGRAYPEHELAAHVVGYTTALTDVDLDRLAAQGYDSTDRVGRYGVERTWESYLRGKPGWELRVVDRDGATVEDEAIVARLIQGDRRIEPVPGDNVVLTLDASLQRLAEKAIAPHRAAAVALVEVDTGKILALVSKPSFDPGVLSGRATRADLAALIDDPARPLVDKTLAARYAPDATYNFVTAIAALEDGAARPDERIACTGSRMFAAHTYTCTARHGSLDLSSAIQRACRVHIWQLAERVGLDRMSEVARSYGFGAPTGLGANGDAAGRVPTRAFYEQRGGLRIGSTLSASVGEGDVEVTVTQLAMAYAALASGTLRVPQLVERVEAASGDVVASFDPKRSTLGHGTAPEILDVIRRGMWRAVNERGGAATFARSPLVEISGQSGGVTSGRQSHAWFAGWAPSARPEVAIVVLIEDSGEASDLAASAARQILEGWWARRRGGS
jgi:penicillin-binding protein 2